MQTMQCTHMFNWLLVGEHCFGQGFCQCVFVFDCVKVSVMDCVVESVMDSVMYSVLDSGDE